MNPSVHRFVRLGLACRTLTIRENSGLVLGWDAGDERDFRESFYGFATRMVEPCSL